MVRRRWIAVTVLILIGLAAATLPHVFAGKGQPAVDHAVVGAPADVPQVQGPPPNVEAQPAVAEDESLREILSIRAGRGTVLQGTLLEQDGATDAGEFLRSLRRVAESGVSQLNAPRQASASASSQVDGATHSTSQHCEAAYDELIAADQPADFPVAAHSETVADHFGANGFGGSEDGAIDPDQTMVRSLRSVCRELDLRAADLEDQRQYNRADQLRRLARLVRVETRMLDGNDGNDGNDGADAQSDVAPPDILPAAETSSRSKLDANDS